MAVDLVGEMGLDVSSFETGIQSATGKIAEAIRSTNLLNTAIGFSAAAIAIWAKNFVEAKQRADQMDTAIKNVAKSLSSPQFSTESDLETRLKEIDGLLDKLSSKRSLSDVIIEKVSDFFTGNDTDKTEDEAGTMAINKRKEIEEALGEKIKDRTKLMALERQHLDEAVAIEKIRLEYAEKRGKVTAANGRLTDAELKGLKDQEAEAIRGVQQKRLEQEQKVTQELKDQLELMKAQHMGNSTAVRRLQSEQEFDRRIRDDYQKNQGRNVEDIEAQRREANMGFAIEERNKTPAQRRAERAAGRRNESDRRRVRDEDEELDSRINRGIRGSRGSRIERRRDELADAAQRSKNIRDGMKPDAEKGFTATDSQNIQTIANAYKSKVGG